MRINTNIAALNSYNQLKNTQNNLSKSLQRLSSGKRINGAADDAAGLAISEKMKAQTSGLAMAQRNAQDGISMIQTAEGALKESHSILQRMRELAVQSANDTNTNADRFEIQKEVNQLTEELTRIGDNTEFNTQKLLDGSLTDAKFQIGANEGQNIALDVNDMRAEKLNVTADSRVSTFDGGSTNLSGTNSISGLAGGSYSAEVTSTGTVTIKASDGTTLASKTMATTGVTSITISGITNSAYLVDGAASGTVTLALSEDTSTTGTVDTAAGTVSMNVLESGQGISVMNQADADDAITTIDNAIARVSSERSKLGAYQNRLDHTINNLNTAEENLTAAESRISDVDMAKEMMSFTKNQILSQAGTAMLAQANQLPQGVLQLLG
jgi:flagellin